MKASTIDSLIAIEDLQSIICCVLKDWCEVYIYLTCPTKLMSEYIQQKIDKTNKFKRIEKISNIYI